MTMNVKADSFHSKAGPDASFQTPHTVFYDSPRCNHLSYRSRRKVMKKDPLLSSIFTENEDQYEDRRFTMEGWNKKPQRIDQQKAIQNESEEDLVNSSQDSLLEGSCRQNIFKNELTNLSNGLFSMHLKDTQRNNISKPYFQALTLKPSLRPVSVLQGRKKIHQNRYMSKERRSSSYVVKDKNKNEEEAEGEGEGELELQIEPKKEKGKTRDKEREKESEKDEENDKKEKEKKKEKIKGKKGEIVAEKEKNKKKEKEKDKEIDEIKDNEKEKEKEREKEREKEQKKIEGEKAIEKEKEKQNTNFIDNKDKDKEKEKEREKSKEKQSEKLQTVIVPKCRFQEKYVKEQEQEKKDKKPEPKKRISGNTKLIDFTAPAVRQKELPNKRLYLKVIQMLEKTKRHDDKPNGINSSSEALVNANAETYEATPNKTTSKQQKIASYSTPPKYLSNSCLTSIQQDTSEAIRVTRKSEASSSKKDVLNESNWSNSPLKDSRTPSKFRSTLQALPAIENNNKTSNSFSNSMHIGALTCHKINRVSAIKCSNSVIYPLSEDIVPEEAIVYKNQSLVLEDEQQDIKKGQYYSQRSSYAYGQSNQLSTSNVEEEFVPYSKQQKSYHAMLEPERKGLDSQVKKKQQGRSSSSTQSKAWGHLEPKLKLKEGAGIKFHVFQLPLPKIQLAAMPLKETVKREKSVKKNKRRDFQVVEDFFRKDEDFETERDIKSRFVKPKVEYLAGGGIRGLSYHKTLSRLSNDISENKGITVSQEEVPGKMKLALQDSTDKMLYLEASVKFMNDDSTEEDL